MRNLFCLTTSFVIVLGAAGCLRGAEESHEPRYYKVTVHVDHEEMKFDLNDKDQRKKFIDLVEQGRVDEIEVQKNPMALSADLGIWALVVFVGLVFILRKLAWGPMVEGLQKREQTIRQAVDEAKLAREETEKVRSQFKKEMDEAFAKIPLMMEKARLDGEKLAEEMRTKAAADITADRDRLRREIALATDQALQTLWDQTAQLATLISANVLARTLTPEDHQRMLNVAVEELKSSGPRFRQDIV
jgi:F-type H+-transporting ATPase subunit b